VKSKGIVIARYAENLSWIYGIDIDETQIYVYNKGNNITPIDPKFKYINISNVGVCDHTYLYHIIKNYDNLEDVTIFIPGSCMFINKIKQKNILFNNLPYSYHSFFTKVMTDDNLRNFKLKYYVTTDPTNRDSGDLELSPCNIRPYGKWYKEVMGKELKSNVINYGGIFSVSKEIIRKKPKSFYENLISYLDKDKFPEASHYMERLWYNLFELDIDKSEYLQNRYLKV
jgi:hypothetical protein